MLQRVGRGLRGSAIVEGSSADGRLWDGSSVD
jgi:hypothetical protein